VPIHPSAIVDKRAEIHESAQIGPYAVIEGPVQIGAETILGPHVVVLGSVTIGERNRLHAGVVIGDLPQDLGYRGGESGVFIGNDNVFREHVQVHRGTQSGSLTRIGDGNFLMTNAHVAHNCAIGNRAIIASGALLAGYVEVGDNAFISGNCVVHQYVRIGRLALLRGLSRTSRDVPPFCIMDGTHTLRAINRVGLLRAGIPRDRIDALRRMFVRLFGERGNLRERLSAIESDALTPEVRELIEFIRSSKRGVCFGPRRGGDHESDSGA
jgi:UDP-N-acetylglucosamine acyltransferase